MEPTYRLAPDETPSLTDIGRVAERLLSNLLHKQQYNGSEAATWVKVNICSALANSIAHNPLQMQSTSRPIKI